MKIFNSVYLCSFNVFFSNNRIECGWKLRHILRGYEGVIKQVHIDNVVL